MPKLRQTLGVLAVLFMFLSLVPAAASSSERVVEQGGTARTGMQGIRRQPRRSPNQPRPVSNTQNSPDAETGTNSQGVSICEGNIYRSSVPNIRQGGFVPNSWVLGLVDNYDQVNHFSFWVESNSSGVVTIQDMTDLFNDGGVVAETVLIDRAGTAIGGCASTIIALGAVNIYNNYWSSSPPLTLADELSLGVEVECRVCDLAGSGVIVEPDAPTAVLTTPVDRGVLTNSSTAGTTVTSGGDFWWYYGSEDETITINLESSDFDSYLTLYDADGNELVANDDRGDGTLHSEVSYTMPLTDYVRIDVRALNGTSTGSYVLYLSSGSPEPEAVTTAAIVCGGYTTRLVVGGQAQRAGNTNVRIRNNPSRSATQLGLINSSAVIPVLDGPQCVDNVPWWQVSYNGVVGWAGEAADGLALLRPAGSTAAQASNPPSASNSSSTAPTVAFVPTAVPPFNPTALPPANTGAFNFSSSPNYGSATLASGFSPDPYPIGMTSGGGVNASYLGGSCVGFATSAPDFRFQYSAGSFPLLRIYFVGSGDTTLIINDPGGGWHCIDDSFSTLNPSLDFNNPASGQYDIWVGSYSADAYVSGTLYITELDGNHP